MSQQESHGELLTASALSAGLGGFATQWLGIQAVFVIDMVDG